MPGISLHRFKNQNQPYITLRHHGFIFIMALLLLSACNRALLAQDHPVTTTPAVSGGIGVMGSSNSDEYRADDNRGGEYSATTLNFVELLEKHRGLNFGEWGTWGEPRRSGYKYNWSRSGATARDLITSGQHTGLAQQVANGEVSYVIFYLGSNDFHFHNRSYRDIYDGTLSDSQVQAKIDTIIADVTTAVDTVLAARTVPMVLVTLGDHGLSPPEIAALPDPAGRQRVSDAIEKTNTGIKAMAEERGVKIVDLNAFGYMLLDQIDENGFLTVGGERINILERGNEPHYLRLDDNVGHPGTVISGLMANWLIIEPFNQEFGLNITPFTDEEILEYAGIY